MNYYEEHAEEYVASTIDANMTAAYGMVRKYLPHNGYVLDVGFGSARDMIFFQKEGYQVTGIDNCTAFVSHAKKRGLDVKCIDILSYHTKRKYDLIWCCASFLHLRKEDILPAVLKYLSFLKKDGVLFLSMKYANKNDGCDENGRYFTYFNDQDIESLKPYTKEVVFEKDATRNNLMWVSLVLRNNVNKEDL